MVTVGVTVMVRDTLCNGEMFGGDVREGESAPHQLADAG